MEEPALGKKCYTLYELNSIIKSAIDLAFPHEFWVTAEIADLKCNQKGHCYIELVEKEDHRTIAQMKANIWAYEYRSLSNRFKTATRESLKPGMRVLLLATVGFHEVYGLSINIKDIDPAYTMGEMARKKREVIERLEKEGIINLNKERVFPLVPQRIAVISSPMAAGYGDFFSHLDNNPFAYTFVHTLFPAVMQGRDAEESVISALDSIDAERGLYDVTVIIRGGGSVIDLGCFDGFPLASKIASFSLPVITGIGHEKDDTVADIVAHTRMKTPTAVAQFLISSVRSFEERVINIGGRILNHAQRLLKDERYRVEMITRSLTHIPLRATAAGSDRIEVLRRELEGNLRRILLKEGNRFEVMEKAVKHLDPENVLRRGYSITRHRGRVVKDASILKKWAVIETRFHKGKITSIVQERKEEKDREQGQTADLLPGFE